MRIDYEAGSELLPAVASDGIVLSVSGGVRFPWPAASVYDRTGRRGTEPHVTGWSPSARYPSAPTVVRTSAGVSVWDEARLTAHVMDIPVHEMGGFGVDDAQIALGFVLDPPTPFEWREILAVRNTAAVVVPGGFVLLDQSRGSLLHVDFTTAAAYCFHSGTAYTLAADPAQGAEDAWHALYPNAVWDAGSPGVVRRATGDDPVFVFARIGVPGRPMPLHLSNPAVSSTGDEVWFLRQDENGCRWTCLRRAGSTGPFSPVSHHDITGTVDGRLVVAAFDTDTATIVAAASTEHESVVLMEFPPALWASFEPYAAGQEYTAYADAEVDLPAPMTAIGETAVPLVSVVKAAPEWIVATPGGVFSRTADASARLMLTSEGREFEAAACALSEPGAFIAGGCVGVNPIIVQIVDGEVFKSRMLILSADFATVLYERVYSDVVFNVHAVRSPGPTSAPVVLGRTSDPPLGFGPDGVS